MAETPSELHAEIEHLERKHAENPDGRFFVPLANAYRKLGELDRAEMLLREGIERHSDYLSARIVLGRCLADRGDADGAGAEFERVLELDPQNLIALRTLGELALAGGRPNDAERWYRDLLSVDPMNDEARRALDEIEAVTTSAEPAPEPGSWWEPGEDDGTAGLELPSSITESDSGSDDEDRSGAPAPAPAFGDGDEDLSDWEEPEHVRSVEVVTETIAELYARQELYDRAAEVYRELIRRRGGDPALEARLAEVEGLARGERSMAPAPEPGPLPGHEAGPEPLGLDGDEMPQPVMDPIDSWDLPDDRPAYTLDLETSEDGAFIDDAAPSEDPFAASFAMGFGDPSTDSVPGTIPSSEGDSSEDALSGAIQTDEGGGSDSIPAREEDALAEFEFAPEPNDIETASSGPSESDDELGITSSPAHSASRPGAADRSAAVDSTLESSIVGSGNLEARSDEHRQHDAPITIAEYLKALADWQPGRSAPPADTHRRQHDERGSSQLEQQSEREQLDRHSDSRSASTADPWSLPDSGASEAESVDAAGPWADQDPGSSEMPSAEADPWSRPDAASSDEPAVDDQDPVIELDDYFSDAAPPPVAGGADEPLDPSSSEREKDSEDEDLESFQAWLRSLKR